MKICVWTLAGVGALALILGCSGESGRNDVVSGSDIELDKVDIAGDVRLEAPNEVELLDIPSELGQVFDVTDLVGETAQPPDSRGDLEPPNPDVLVGHWQQLPTNALGEHVLKSIWGFEDGNVVAVGEAGLVAALVKGTFVVAYQNPSLNILNGVWGSSSSDVWTVGMYGLIYHYDGTKWGIPEQCYGVADCSYAGICLTAQCVAGACSYTPTGNPKCCGAQHFKNAFDQGADPFVFSVQDLYKAEGEGGVTWQVVSIVGPDGKPRFSSPPNALYFGIPSKQCMSDPSLLCPDFSNGKKVGATATSPSITIPQTAETATLSFTLYLDVEASPLSDLFKVRVFSSSKWVDVWSKADLAGNFPKDFKKIHVDLSKYIGKTIQIQFFFDSVDAENNALEGVYVDDVMVSTTCSIAGALAGKFPTLWSVWGASSGQIFAVGNEGNILYYDGVSWQKQAGGETHIPTAIHGPSTDDVVMVGKEGLVLHSKGAGWEKENAPTSNNLVRVWGTSPNRYVAVGPVGTALAYNGEKWSAIPGAGMGDMNNVIGFADDDYYLVGNSGKIFHYDGVSLSQLPPTTPADLYGIWGDNSQNVMVVGKKVILSGSVNALVNMDAPIVTTWTGVWGVGEHRYVVGQYGKILHFDGVSWEKMDSGVETQLNDVWGFSTSDVYAVGDAATILHWDGTKWNKVPPIGPPEVIFTDVWGPSPDEVYVVAQTEDFGYVLGWDGISWKVAYSRSAATLRHVHGSSVKNVFAVGQGGTIMHYNGKGWGLSLIDPIEMEDGSLYYVTQGLYGVWTGSTTNAWAVGEEGVIVHYDGKSFSLVGMFGSTLRTVFGLSPENVWAAGNSGVILRFDGQEWKPEPSGTVATIYSIWGSPNHGIYATGDSGTVLRYVVE